MVKNTANRTATVTAGEFAVVKTGGSLSHALSNGVGVNVNGVEPTNHNVYQKTNYKLTDASLDIASATSDVVIPDLPRSKVAYTTALSSLSESAPNLRDTNTFSAFKWDITFTLSFSETATKNVGLFFDAANSWAHIAYKAKEGDKSDGLYYTKADLSGAPVENNANLTADTLYYRAAPKTAYVAEELYTAEDEAENAKS